MWSRHEVDQKLTSIDKIWIICRSHVRHMSTTWDRQKSTCTRPKWTSDQHTIDKKRQKSWILMSTSYRHKNLCRYHVDTKFHGFCRFLSFFVDGMLIWCPFWSSICWVYVDDIRRHESTSYRHRFLCRHDVDKKVDKNRPKSTKSRQKSTKICRHHVDKRHQTDTRTTQGARTTCVFFKLFYVDFMLTKWQLFVDFWSILVVFGRFSSILVDTKSTKINQNRPKLVDTMSTNDIRTTSERHKGRGKHVSFLSRFLSTSCRQNDYFLSTFCRFWSIFVDFGRFWSTFCRPKSTKIDQNHVSNTCRTCVVDALSTKSRQKVGDIFTMYPLFINFYRQKHMSDMCRRLVEKI